VRTQIWIQIVWVPIFAQVAIAQVVPDRTLPVGEQSGISGDPNIQIDGGATRGTNLFHSFQQFSIPTDSSVFFNNSTDIANIITRITGNSRSNIDGLMRANGTANLFLINPNGIIFGPNARLEIGGSFLASTADGLKFADGFEFSAKAPQSQPLLTISAPSGLQYGSDPGEIRVQGADLQVPDGRTLALAGGDVSIDRGEFGALLAPGGRVELAGVAAPGVVGLTQQGQEWRLNLPEGLARADVAILAGYVDVSAAGGGSIAINARNLTAAGRNASGRTTLLIAGIAGNLVGTQAGDIDINATEAVRLDDNSAIANLAGGSSPIANPVGGKGDAGNINLTAGSLILNNSIFIVSTSGEGNAGNVKLTVRGAATLDGSSTQVQSSINRFGRGRGGNIELTSGSLTVTNGARLAASTAGEGDAGSVKLTVRGAAIFDGTDRAGRASGVFGQVNPGGRGKGGNVELTAGSLAVTNGARLSTNTRDEGDAGSMKLTVSGAATFDGTTPDGQFPSGALAAVVLGARGQGGDIELAVGSLNITNGAQLSASSNGQGAAGNLDVTTRQLRLDNQGSIQAQTASGQGGNIRLQVQDQLLLRRGSFISTTAGTAQAGGDGGNITLNSKFIVAIPKENNDISANAFTGSGGKVNITAKGILGIQFSSRSTPLSDITASSDFGISGTVTLNTPDVDPSRGTTPLPTGLIDTNALISSSCLARRDRQGRFIITGTGGLATQPDDLANAAFPTYELVADAPKTTNTLPSAPLIVEADRAVRLSNGNIVFGRSCQ
jgi:filamentous hemagglutinin family protein